MQLRVVGREGRIVPVRDYTREDLREVRRRQLQICHASAGDVQFAQYSSNIVLLSSDPDKIHEDTRLVMKTIQNLGFACRLETVNAIEAWRGTLPGDGYRNVRRTLIT